MVIPTKDEMYAALKSRHGSKIQKKISKTTVAVCGLGGLGSNIAISLSRLGIGKLILIDFDSVDLKNLNRQQYAIKHIGMYKTEAMKEILTEIMPYTKLEIHTIRLSETNVSELISEADIICEAFDTAENKAVLVNAVLEMFPTKYIVSASGLAGLGPSNVIHTRKITNNFYICGDGESDVSEYGTLYATRAMLCAAHQAHTVLRIIAGEFNT